MSQRPIPDERPLPGVDLGYHGAVRFRVAPVVELEPSTEPITIDTLRVSPFTLKGTVRNLKEAVGCRLKWKVLASIAATQQATERLVDHPRPTVLVPSGTTYEIKEQGANGPVPLVVDAFELDLIGTGRLGYTLELQMIDQRPLSVPSATSNIEINLPVTVSFRPEAPKPPIEPTDREAKTADNAVPTDDLEQWAREVLAGSPPTPQTQSVDAPLKVGGLVSFEVVSGQGFVGHPLTLEIAEYAADAHEVPKEVEGTRSTFTWTPTGPGKETFQWRVGMVRRGGNHVLAPSLVDAGTRFFRWTVSASRSSPSTAAPAATASSVPDANVVTSSPVQFCTAEHPHLAELSLSERAASSTDDSLSDAVVSARFENLDPSIEFDMELELMVKTEKPSPRMVQLSKLLSELGRTDEVRSSARVRMGALYQPAMRLSDCRETLKSYDPQLGLFGVISFGPAAVSTHANCVFNAVAGYAPNLESAPDKAGFAPFRSGWLTRPEVASGVCTKLMTLEGTPEDLAGSMAIPQPLWQEYRVFLAIVVGEALSSTEISWRGVAHTMLNRRNSQLPDWTDWTTIEKVATARSQFDSYGGDLYRQAMAYFERKYVKKDAVDRTETEKKIARMEDVLIPLFMAGLGEQPEAGCGPHNGWGVNFFFSPIAQANKGRSPPSWSKLYDDLTGNFSPPGGGLNRDFRFYRRRREHGV